MLYAAARPVGPLLVRDNSGARYGRDLREDLWEFLCLRLDRLNPHESSAEYRHWHGEAGRLHDRLDGLLGAEGQALLREYSDALGEMHYLEMMLLAERALLDGMSLGVGTEGEG